MAFRADVLRLTLRGRQFYYAEVDLSFTLEKLKEPPALMESGKLTLTLSKPLPRPSHFISPSPLKGIQDGALEVREEFSPALFASFILYHPSYVYLFREDVQALHRRWEKEDRLRKRPFFLEIFPQPYSIAEDPLRYLLWELHKRGDVGIALERVSPVMAKRLDVSREEALDILEEALRHRSSGKMRSYYDSIYFLYSSHLHTLAVYDLLTFALEVLFSTDKDVILLTPLPHREYTLKERVWRALSRAAFNRQP